MNWTAEKIAALPEGPSSGMQEVILTPEESAKGEKTIVGGRSVTFTPGIRSLKLPDPRPTVAIFLDDDDVQSYVDADGIRWSLGRYANGEWFRSRR